MLLLTRQQASAMCGISLDDISCFVAQGELSLLQGSKEPRISIFELAKLLKTTAQELLDLIGRFASKNFVQPKELVEETISAVALTEEKPAQQKNNEVSSKTDALTVDYLNNYVGNIKTIEGLNSLKIIGNKNSTRIFLRVKGEDDLDLLKVNKPNVFTEQDIINIRQMYDRYVLLRKEGRPWNDIKYLRQDALLKIVTFEDLLMFYYNHEETSDDTRGKILRMMNRYFSGDKKLRKLNAYCGEQFSKDFLEVSHCERAKTDRDTVIKLMTTSYNKAMDSSEIANRDFPNLVKSCKRNRSDKTDKETPDLGVYIRLLNTAERLGEDQLALNLLLQEDVAMRKAATTHSELDIFNFENNSAELCASKNKNGQYGRHIFSDPIKGVIDTYLSKLKRDPLVTKNSKGIPLVLFESPQTSRKGLPRANFDIQFKRVKETLIKEIEVDMSLSGEEAKVLIKRIKLFTQHRIRDLNDILFKAVGSTNGQKEKAAGRKPRDVEEAYEALSPSAIHDLKNKKHKYIVNEYPLYNTTIERLVARWKAQ